MAALQAQMLGISLPNSDTLSAKFVNAFWLAGISLDILGAVLATMTVNYSLFNREIYPLTESSDSQARWFEVLHPPEVELLNSTWVANRIPLIPPERSRRHPKGFIEYCVARALFSGLGVLAVGVVMFFIGLMVFIWAEQPLLVSIIGTIPVALLAPLVGCLFIPHANGRQNIIEILARQKGNW